MAQRVNQGAYRLWAPVYDLLFGALTARRRGRAVALLDLHPGECLLIPGVGTGLDLPLLPPGVQSVGLDFSPAMLAQARRKVTGPCIHLLQADALRLPFPDGAFDAVLFNLVLSVVPDGAAAFRECWRALKPGGRAAVFDKFLPEGRRLTGGQRLIGGIFRALGTDVNRRWNDITAGVAGVRVLVNEASLLGGRYRVLLLEKQLHSTSS